MLDLFSARARSYLLLRRQDRTFGLKNKKGAKQQKFIQQVQNQVKHGQGNKKVEVSSHIDKKKEKEKELKDLNSIFRPVIIQSIVKGADPKSVLCAFYKQGYCIKGDKCKFSHDLTLGRKSEKRSAYMDLRDIDNDNMENWDDEKLRNVVDQKHGEKNERQNETKIDKKKEDKQDEMSLEELVEKERTLLGNNLTPVTSESFKQWKKQRLEQQSFEFFQEHENKQSDYKISRRLGLSGRDVLTFNPELATEDIDEEEEICDVKSKNEQLENQKVDTDELYDATPINEELFIEELEELNNLQDLKI